MEQDLDNYHLKELLCSTVVHADVDVIISRGVVLLILLMEYKGDHDNTYRHTRCLSKISSSSIAFIYKALILPRGLVLASSPLRFLRSRGVLLHKNAFVKYSTNMRRIDADFSHAPPNEYSPRPDDMMQCTWCGLTSTNSAVHVNDKVEDCQATFKVPGICLRLGMLVWGGS
ncbi:hypothetical protein Tco_0595279 [Tanacetum coccineum]